MTQEDMHVIIDNAAYDQRDNPLVQELVKLTRKLVKDHAQHQPSPVHQKSGCPLRY